MSSTEVSQTPEMGTLPESFSQQPLPAFDPGDKTMVFMAQLADRWRVAKIIAASGLTKHRSPEAILAIMMWGYELDVPPMLALRNMYFFDGNLGMSADLMAALFIRNGGKIEVLEWTTEKFRARFSRPGWEPSEMEYTVDDAREAGLLNKPNWKNKKAMLSARCRAMGCRAVAPDVFAGQYTIEELRDIAPEGLTGGVHVSQAGAVASRLRELAAGAPALTDLPVLPDPPAVPAERPSAPAGAVELDAVGLRGDVPSGAPASQTDKPGPKVTAFVALVNDTSPTGKGALAEDGQRVSLRRLAQAISAADADAADRLLALANDPKLSRQQAQSLVNAGFPAAVELGVDVGGAGAAPAGDELPLEG